MKVPPVESLLRAAMLEDAPGGDLTSRLTVASALRSRAHLIARCHGVAAGLPVFARAFGMADRRCRTTLHCRDGKSFSVGAVLAEVRGPARALLLAERVALNFLQRLCGVATLTAAYVTEARGTRAKILDTRKTTPLFRALEKYAVRCGGGFNHRLNLSDAVLIKDNHIRLCGGSPGEAVRRARRGAGVKTIEVEVETMIELEDALRARPDIVLLDNMPPAVLKKAVARVRAQRPRCVSEISGGVRIKDVRRLARLGVDHISVGALTHSAPALDLSLEFV